MKIFLIQTREEEKEMAFEREAFFRSTGLGKDELAAVDFLKDGLPQDVLQGDAIIIGGSRFGVAKNDSGLLVPKLEDLIKMVNSTIKIEMPLLGVCFGHQLLAYVCGGDVICDKKNEEYGTYLMGLEDAAKDDPLFSHLPQRFNAQCAHHDRVQNLPPGAVLLAGNERSPIQAFRIDKKVYGIQFHPERSKEDYENIIKFRFKDHGAPEWAAKLAPSPEAESVMRKFIELVRGSP